ncbi:hypothetical protein [Methanoregula sp.]|jgi:hypothetical protein|uniref:hypothetical protein n=1 Tax=Methanoregula sp. TaxID=2052170 RepID=UPI003563FBF3
MLKYLREIFISVIVSIILFAVVTFFTGSVVAGISVFTAVLVTINFILNRYETRNDATVELKITNKENTPFFSVSIVNTGGKIIYLDKGGVKTKEGIIVDFDEEVKTEIVAKKEPKKPKSSFPFLDSLPDYNLKLPALKLPAFFIVNPGDAKTFSKKGAEVLTLLTNKKVQPSKILELKGFFTDQLNHEYESEWVQFDVKPLVESILQDMNNREK